MMRIPFSDDGLREALSVLHDGGVIAHATETCYGFACNLSNPEAVKKLFAIKQRPGHQPVSALFTSVDEAKTYVEWDERAEELAKQYLPGPLTLILRMRDDPSTQLYPTIEDSLSGFRYPHNRQRPTDSGQRTIGIRVSSSPIAGSLVESFGSPLSTTSANLHGQPNPYSADDIEAQFADQAMQPDLILDSGALPQNPPSTVVDLSGNDQIHRQGSIKV
jgi:L-threonylcarbamoyladenylate synthase